MTGYTKLFTRILDSTIWQEDNPTRILWITMLAMVDRDGLILASIPGLAKRANISLSECELALAKFQEPDPYSQSQVAEGRRIEVVQGGWHLINYDTYRHQLSAAEQRDKDRIRKAQYRMSQKSGTKRDSPAMSRDVSLSPAESDIAAATASSTEEESKDKKAHFVRPTREQVLAYCSERKNGIDPDKFLDWYDSIGWVRGKTPIKNWRACVRTWEQKDYGGQFHDGYQKTGRAERGQLGTQKQRELDNARAIAKACGLDVDSVADGAGQETRPDGRSYALLEGKIKTIP